MRFWTPTLQITTAKEMVWMSSFKLSSRLLKNGLGLKALMILLSRWSALFEQLVKPMFKLKFVTQPGQMNTKKGDLLIHR